MTRRCLLLSAAATLYALAPWSACADFGDTLFVAVSSESLSMFGYCVNSVGDLNGDGYNDIGVGEPAVDYWSGNWGPGRAFIYFTGSSIDDIPDLVITGTADNQMCGGPAQRAGDMNGDGRDDLAVGAPGYGGFRGRVFLFWGGAGLVDSVSAGNADVKFTGESYEDWFGYPIRPVGDLNRDGLDDLFVSAADAGRAYVFFGDSTLSGVVPAADADLIFDVAPRYLCAIGCGDLNGDAQPDFALGAPILESGGAVYLFFGDSTWADTTLTALDADVVIATAGTTWAGSSLACDGDLDGDGFDDLAVGATGWDYPDDDGAVLVFYGRSVFPDTLFLTDLVTDADWIIEGEGFDYHVGQPETQPVLGDQDGDGCEDLVVVGHCYGGATLGQIGRTYLFVGDPVRRTGLCTTADAEHIWAGPPPPPTSGFGKGSAWIPNLVPGSTGAFAFGATANWTPELHGKVYVFDAGEGWSPVGARATTARTPGARLFPGRPNPFDAATAIRFELPAEQYVSLTIYDVAGRLVRTLVAGKRAPGHHVVSWDRTSSHGARMPSGVYFVRLKTQEGKAARKLVVID